VLTLTTTPGPDLLLANIVYTEVHTIILLNEQEAQLMLTTGSTRLAVSRGQQTWYFGSIATFR